MFEIVSEHFGGEVKVLKATAYYDDRGSFTITYLEDEFQKLGLPKFVRQMHTRSWKNVIRGLHFQLEPAMGKLIEVVRGHARLVTVDMRPDSPTFLQHHSIDVMGGDKILIWAPFEFARGYQTFVDDTLVQYSCDSYYAPEGEKAIRWNDPDIGIEWGAENLLSEKDKYAPTVAEFFGGKNA